MGKHRNIASRIQLSGLSIYDPLYEREDLYIATKALQTMLSKSLVGLNLDFPLRTRSKVLKSRVCEALGYPMPTSFRKTKPRFPGQNFDTYVQKSNNLQIWNEEVAENRRYVIVRVDENQVVSAVCVVTGAQLALLDKTGTLTHKYQARARATVAGSRLVSGRDTSKVARLLTTKRSQAFSQLLSIDILYQRLKSLLGLRIPVKVTDRERVRGGLVHQAVHRLLGLDVSTDTGQFPDIPEQLLEVKLQTSSTVDLGLVCPDDTNPIEKLPRLRPCDVRFAVFYGTPLATEIRLDHLILSTGESFFTYFRRFEGNVRNSKLQIPLPENFFG